LNRKKLIIWKVLDKDGNTLSSGILDHKCMVDTAYLEAENLTLVEKEFEIDYSMMNIYQRQFCYRHKEPVEMGTLDGELFVCGECIEENKKFMPEDWQKDIKEQGDNLREALAEVRERRVAEVVQCHYCKAIHKEGDHSCPVIKETLKKMVGGDGEDE